MSPHTGQNGYHQNKHKQQMLVRIWSKGNHHTLLVGRSIGAALKENSLQVFQKPENRATI